MGARRLALVVVEVVAALALLAGAFHEHRAGGVEGELIALGLLLAPAHARRLLALLGLAPAPSPLLLAPEALALAGLASYPVAPWALVAALVSALGTAAARPRPDDPPGPAPLRTLAPALLAVALAFLVRDLVHDRALAAVRLVLFLPVLLEGLWLARARTVARALAQAAGALALVGSSWSWQLAQGPGALALVSALVPAALVLLLLRDDRLDPALTARRPVPEPARRAARGFVALALAIAAIVLFVVPLAWRRTRIEIDPARLTLDGKRFAFELARFPAADLLDDASVLEDGRPLARVNSDRDLVLGAKGAYRIAGARALGFTSSDGTDPRTNGRHYAVELWPVAVRTLAGKLAAALLAAAVLLAWRLGALALGVVATRRQRALATAAVALAVIAGLPRSWDAVGLERDSRTYASFYEGRMPLYCLFLRAFDGEPGTELALPADNFPHEAPHDRFITAVRVQKLVTVAALAALVWTLSGSVDLWLLLAIVWACALDDTSVSFLPDDRLSGNASYVLSEALNLPLVWLFFVASLVALKKPGWRTGGALTVALELLAFTRPANLIFAAVFVPFALADALAHGWKPALARSAALGAAFVLPLAVLVAIHSRTMGYAKLHAATGTNTISVALQVATPEDVEAFPEPELRAFARACIVDEHAKWIDYRVDWGQSNNVALYDIAVPVYDRLFHAPPGKNPVYFRDEVFTKVGSRLVARHRRELFERGLFHLAIVLEPLVDGIAVLAYFAALVLFLRSRRAELLWLAFLGTLPFASMLPTCFLTIPVTRYRSQLWFLELVAAPLVLAVVFTLGSAAWKKPEKS